MSKSGKWQHRKADTDEERFGLLDNPKSLKYRNYPTFQEPKGSRTPRPLKALGVTSGIGSMLVGAKKLGFEILGNVEWRDYYRYRTPGGATSTFLDNFPGAYLARGVNDVPRALGEAGTTIDFIAGHPECGVYSSLSATVGGRDHVTMKNTDASDIPLFLRYISHFQPRFFLMDDLPPSFQALPMQAYVDLLPNYDLFPEWVSNWGYGNVQKMRNRMFIVGSLKSERFVFRPNEMHHTRVFRDDVADLMHYPLDGSFPNHQGPDLQRVPGRFVNMRYLGDRPTWADLFEIMQDPEIGTARNKPYVSLAGEYKTRPGTGDPYWDGPCPVLSGGYNPFHPLLHRPMTVRERARVQGFPDDFIFYHSPDGPHASVWEPYDTNGQRGVKQTGKAMPIQFCEHVAREVQAHILGETTYPTCERILKPNKLVSAAKLEFCKASGYANQEKACHHCWMEASCELRKTNFISGQQLSLPLEERAPAARLVAS